MTGHPLDASTGTQPSTQSQRLDHVTAYRDDGSSNGHTATLHMADNSVACSHQCILFDNSHISVKLKTIYKFHFSFSYTDWHDCANDIYIYIYIHTHIINDLCIKRQDLEPWHKGRGIITHQGVHFGDVSLKFSFFIQNFKTFTISLCFQGLDCQYVSIDSDNGLTLTGDKPLCE